MKTGDLRYQHWPFLSHHQKQLQQWVDTEVIKDIVINVRLVVGSRFPESHDLRDDVYCNLGRK